MRGPPAVGLGVGVGTGFTVLGIILVGVLGIILVGVLGIILVGLGVAGVGLAVGPAGGVWPPLPKVQFGLPAGAGAGAGGAKVAVGPAP